MVGGCRHRAGESTPDDAPRPGTAAFAEKWWTERGNQTLHEYTDLVSDAGIAGLPVRLGIEADYFPGAEGAIRTVLAQAPFDYVIGSVHWIGPWGFDLLGCRRVVGWPRCRCDVSRLFRAALPGGPQRPLPDHGPPRSDQGDGPSPFGGARSHRALRRGRRSVRGGRCRGRGLYGGVPEAGR